MRILTVFNLKKSAYTDAPTNATIDAIIALNVIFM